MFDVIFAYCGWFVATYIKPYHDEILAVATAIIAIYTFVLAKVARRQTKDTRILHRAYIRVDGGEIRTTTTGEYVAHVIIKNVGHLPASNFTWDIKKIYTSTEGDWQPPKLQKFIVTDDSVLPFGLPITRGSAGSSHDEISIHPPEKRFLYVYGRIEYGDGFNKNRFTNFCYRYNWINEQLMSGGGRRIASEHARYHERGNDAN